MNRWAALSRCCHWNVDVIESRLRGQVIGHGSDPACRQQGERFPAHLLEREVSGDTIIRKQLEYLASLRHVGVRLQPELADPLPGGLPGILVMPTDMVQQALDQVVVQSLVAVLDEAQQVHVNHGFAQLPEPVDRVIIHQRRIIRDVFLRDVETRQQPLRHVVQRPHLLATLGFAPDFMVAEVLRVALEQGDGVQSLRVFEQAV